MPPIVAKIAVNCEIPLGVLASPTPDRLTRGDTIHSCTRRAAPCRKDQAHAEAAHVGEVHRGTVESAGHERSVTDSDRRDPCAMLTPQNVGWLHATALLDGNPSPRRFDRRIDVEARSLLVAIGLEAARQKLVELGFPATARALTACTNSLDILSCGLRLSRRPAGRPGRLNFV